MIVWISCAVAACLPAPPAASSFFYEFIIISVSPPPVDRSVAGDTVRPTGRPDQCLDSSSSAWRYSSRRLRSSCMIERDREKVSDGHYISDDLRRRIKLLASKQASFSRT